jgi:hypothetical protein
MFAASKTASVSGGYQISRSLRFNSADSANLRRTYSTSGTNNKIRTISAWVKRSTLGAVQVIMGGDDGGANQSRLLFQADDTLNLRLGGGASNDNVTTAVFRDPSAWYHIVALIDTTQATAANRAQIYINGVQQTISSPTSTLNQTTAFANPSSLNTIGEVGGTGSSYFGGYMTEFYFVDGQALTPSSFGETNAQTGVWQPKAYSGSYGTNGFYLNFSDNSNTTAATLGKDYSGNGNNWTPNNFSVTAGAGNDSLVDSPTSYGTDTGVGGTVRGNYCTWNPLNNPQSAVLTNGNLDLSTAGVTARYGTLTTIGVNSAKWYWEITAGSLSSDGYEIGIASASKSATSALGSDTESYIYLVNGDKRTNATTVAYGATYTAGDVIGVALDLDAGTLVFYKNGTSQGTAYTSIPSNTWFPTVADDNTGSTTGSSFIANFGQRAFAYTAPSGFKALCTQNLPTPAIGATSATLANKYFDVSTWSGTGSNISVTNSGGFQPDWVWAKCRSNAGTNNILEDAVRGVNYWLASDSTSSESGLGSPGPITAFNSGGFSGDTSISGSGRTYVGWQWKANGSGSSNTSGSITSTVSANTTSGFSVVTYTGTGSAATVGHGLGVALKMVIVKRRDAVNDWAVWQTSITGGQYLLLDTTGAVGTDSGIWNNTMPTSTVFSVGTSSNISNAAGGTYVAYCFAPISGFSAFGSYTGNGSTDGTFVYFGFRPAYVMIKASSAVDNWVIMDVARNPYNAVNYWLQAESSAAEATLTPPQFDFNSNGMKLRGTSSTCNGSGVTYIYMAFAQNPFKYSLAR